MATLCFFIQSHRDPEQIHRLVRTLRQGCPASPILLQHNPSGCRLDPSPFADLEGVHFLTPSRPQVRANYSCQVQPYLDAIDWLEREGVEYSWLMNLTAQDYPVKPLAEIEAFYKDAECDGFIRYWDVFSAESPWSHRKPRARYYHRYRRLGAGAEPWLKAAKVLTRILPLHFYLDYGPLVGVRALRTPFQEDFRCYGGWAWFSLRKRAVLYLRDFLRQNPNVVRHYQGTVTPEESIVQTVLVNSGLFSLVNDDYRLIDYSKAVKGSPKTMTTADLPELKCERYHFARKFDLGVDREVLDRIDHELLGMAAG